MTRKRVLRRVFHPSAVAILLLGALVAPSWAQAPGQDREDGTTEAPSSTRTDTTEAPSSVRADTAAVAGAAESSLRPVVEAARRSGPIHIDGRIDEAAWKKAPPTSGFVESQPVEGEPAVNDTQVRVLYDNDAIYVAARMFDSDPSTIADQVVRRDQMGQYDFIAVGLDPNLDRRTGYYFQVSAAGVQRDAYIFDDRQMDDHWDAVWESAVARDSLGWTAEMRIPLSQIRYDPADTAQTWGIEFQRRRVASNEFTELSLISRLQEGLVSQFGYLEGVRIEDPTRSLEFLPYVVARGHTAPAEAGNPFFDGSSLRGRVGTDLKMGIGGSFTLDGTVNPDFGQVEADPAVINLSAYETYFQERRPFFVEDASLFNFPISGQQSSLFYSRRIGRAPHGSAPDSAEFSKVPQNTTILGAAKISGRTAEGLSMGALTAVTAAEYGKAELPGGSIRRFMVEPRAEYGVFRLRQDFNNGASQIGGIFTALHRDLPADGSFDNLSRAAYTGGLDFQLQWADRTWALHGYLAGSDVRGDTTAMIDLQRSSIHYFQRPDARYVSMDSSATSMRGATWRLDFNKQRGEWTGGLFALQVSPGFDVNDLGFDQEQERFSAGGRFGFRKVVPGNHLRNWNVDLFTFQNFSHDLLKSGLGSWKNWRDAHIQGMVQLQSRAQFLNYWGVDANVGYSPQGMSRTATRGGPVMVDPAAVELRLGLRSDRRNRFNFRPQINVRNALLGGGHSVELGLQMELRPSSRLQIRVEPRYTRQANPAQYVETTSSVPYAPTYGSRYLFGRLKRRELSVQTRVDWAFSPDLTLQVYAQPLISSGDYVQYRQLKEPGTFQFNDFTEGTATTSGGHVVCRGGQTCETSDGTRWIDFNGDGVGDYSFSDPNFNVRSLIGDLVLRWEFRPGSRIFLVWQHNQYQSVDVGDFSLGRDTRALFSAPSDDVLILKVDYWIGL